MNSNKNIVILLSQKLCLTPDVSKKAEELLRLLDLKTTTTSSALAISETCRTVVCLGLAAASLGVYCDKTNAIKLSGVKKSVYLRNCHIIKKLLHLDEQLHVKDVCVRLNVEEASELATRLMNRFMAEKSSDPSHPMYPTVAVLVACRHLRLRVDKSAFVEMSCLKRSAFDSLVAEFGKVVEHMLPPSNKIARKRSHVLSNVMQNSIKDSQKTLVAETEDGSEVGAEVTEDYKDWKKRILLQGSSDDQT